MQDTAKEVVKEEQEESDVRVSIGGNVAVECSAISAAKILKEFFMPPEREPFRPLKTAEAPPPVLIKPPDAGANQFKEDRQSAGWGKRLIVLAAVAIFLFLFVSAGQSYLENHKNQASATANHEITMLSSAAYDKILALHLDELLRNLKELTSIDRFGKAFPDITIMHTTVITKRGPETAKMSEAALEFIKTTKGYFDRWTARRNDWTAKLKPTEEDIAVFLSIWEGTKPLLNRLQEAQNDPLGFLIEKAQLPTS